jgi:hypothetical protein
MAVSLKIIVLWDVTPCNLVDLVYTRLHNVTFQKKTILDIYICEYRLV